MFYWVCNTFLKCKLTNVLYTFSFSTLPRLFSLFNAFLFASNKACKCLLTLGLPLTRRKLQLFAFWRVLSLGSSFKGLHFQRKCLCDGKVFKFYTSFILENHSETKLSFFWQFFVWLWREFGLKRSSYPHLGWKKCICGQVRPCLHQTSCTLYWVAPRRYPCSVCFLACISLYSIYNMKCTYFVELNRSAKKKEILNKIAKPINKTLAGWTRLNTIQSNMPGRLIRQ